ncbi:MAG: DUF6414 family protein [Actinomycetota bacterium]
MDFVLVEVGERELLVHREVLDRLPPARRPKAEPPLVVGVAEEGLFWKDIRRVLFSNSRFRVFSRISQTGLRDRWTPVKLTDVLKEIAPEFEAQLLGALGESTLSAMGDAIARTSSAEDQARVLLQRAAAAFLEAVVEHHGAELEPARLSALAVDAVERGGTLTTTDDRRQFYGQLLRQLDAELSVDTSPEVAEACRVIATSEAGLGLGGQLVPIAVAEPAQTAGSARLLDTEIVAIYW